MVIQKIFRIIVFVLIGLFVIGIVDYFLIRAGLISIDTSQLPDFLQSLLPN